jgi:hypothetical protein
MSGIRKRTYPRYRSGGADGGGYALNSHTLVLDRLALKALARWHRHLSSHGANGFEHEEKVSVIVSRHRNSLTKHGADRCTFSQQNGWGRRRAYLCHYSFFVTSCSFFFMTSRDG